MWWYGYHYKEYQHPCWDESGWLVMYFRYGSLYLWTQELLQRNEKHWEDYQMECQASRRPRRRRSQRRSWTNQSFLIIDHKCFFPFILFFLSQWKYIVENIRIKRAFASCLFRNIGILSIDDLNPAFSQFTWILMGSHYLGFEMLWLSVECPEFILQLLSDDLQFNWIVENEVTEFGSDEESCKHDQVISSEWLSIKIFDLVLDC